MKSTSKYRSNLTEISVAFFACLHLYVTFILTCACRYAFLRGVAKCLHGVCNLVAGYAEQHVMKYSEEVWALRGSLIRAHLRLLNIFASYPWRAYITHASYSPANKEFISASLQASPVTFLNANI